jgi:ABC-type branched-subunit amino acid transport system substrate-binding protein/outer membrane murein-binding lipoprotein Lpp
MTMKNLSNPTTALALIIVLVLGSAGGYFYSSGTYEPKIDAFETQVSELSKNVDELNTDVSSLEESNQVKENEIASLESQMSSLEEELQETQSQLADSMNQVQSLESEVSDLEQKLEEYYEMNPIRIGLTSRSTEFLKETTAVKEIAEKDINRYCKEQGVPYTFEFVLGNNEADLETTLTNTFLYHLVDVNLIVGHGYSSQCQVSLDFVNENDMLLLSAGSSNPLLSIKDDNLYRVAVVDTVAALPISTCLVDKGIEAIIVLHRNDDWGSILSEAVKERFEAQGGVVYQVTPYNINTKTYVGFLENFETVVLGAVDEYGLDKVGIVLLSFDEAGAVVRDAKYFPLLYNLTWFGWESTAHVTERYTRLPLTSASIQLFSPIVARNSELFDDFALKMDEYPGLDVGIYEATMYDACWLYALSVIEVGNTNTSYVKDVLPVIAETYEGASGFCALDENGDKVTSDFEIWSLAVEEGVLVNKKIGYYHSESDDISWIT